MASLIEDQAAGLRRLFGRVKEPVTIAFAGARGAGGRAGVIAGLARGLAAAGKEVVVVDENPGADSVASEFRLSSRFDLLQAVNCDVPLARVVLQAGPAVRLVPAARAARESGRLDGMQRRAIAEWLRRLQKGVDFVLVDTAGRADGDLSPLLPAPSRVVVVAAASSLAITEAYAQIKRLAQGRGSRGFDIIVSRAAGRAEGETVFANMREVARRHLGVNLELLGCVPAGGPTEPACDAMAKALLGLHGGGGAPAATTGPGARTSLPQGEARAIPCRRGVPAPSPA